jgi:hypothetical protein
MAKKEFVKITPEGLNLVMVLNYGNQIKILAENQLKEILSIE